jgi:peptidylprolyl isomerase
MFKHVTLDLIALALLVFIGCAKAPEIETQKANSAMEAAKTAEADIYAPESFRLASDTLGVAATAKQEADGKFALTRNYSKAAALYANAELLANKAVQDATAKKAEAQNNANLLMPQVKELIDSAMAMVNKTRVTPANKDNVESVKQNLAKSESAYTEAQRDFESGKYMMAWMKLKQLSMDIPELTTSIKGTTAMKEAGNPIVVIQTNMGDITLEVFEKETPVHAKNFLDRVDNKLYNGIIFHRVVKGFVIQGGDPTGTGMGAPDEPKLADEVSPFSNIRPYVTMARSQAGASASQFYVNLKDNSFLDKQKFSPFAKVVEGMEIVDKIGLVPVGAGDKPNDPVTMIKVYRKK